jgi:hypothetical protein
VGREVLKFLYAFLLAFLAVGLLTIVRRHETDPVMARILVVLIYLTGAFAVIAKLQ